ncbi:MAG: response regulator [Deltaproteobacteria bacterium]|nr:response regulator [Deltaproteobacteria bacterium]
MIDKESEDTTVDTTGLEIPRGHGEAILVVDDEAAVLRVAQKTLAQAGYTVLTAKDPERALDLFQVHHGDIYLLLIDVVMPEMSGKELAEAIEAIRPNTKMLFMSGYTSIKRLQHRVLEADVRFIRKPFTSERLTRKVWEVLNTGEW